MTIPRIFRIPATRIYTWIFIAGAILGNSPAQQARFSLDIHETATTEQRTISATGYRPTASPWVVERSLSMTPGGEGLWFPFYQEDASFADLGPLYPDGTRLSPMNFTLRVLPPLPPPPPASPSSGVPRARYLYGHTTLQIAADGAVYAFWPSLDNSGTMAHTIFPADPVPELNLLNPDATASNQNRPIFGVGIQNQAASGGLPPLTISFVVAARPPGQPFPSGLPPLGQKDGFIREGLKAFGPAIREDCWPVFGPPGPPPPPPTLNDRSFYRVKVLDPLHDANENGFPDELEGLYSNLLISEVCYVSLTAVPAHQPHTFLPAGEDSVLQPAFLNRPPDWVEILNPTDHDISTAGYFFSDDPDLLTRFPLPASAIIPAYGTLILLLTDDPHPLFSTEGDPNSMVRKC